MRDLRIHNTPVWITRIGCSFVGVVRLGLTEIRGKGTPDAGVERCLTGAGRGYAGRRS
jgi:hypothetical protein